MVHSLYRIALPFSLALLAAQPAWAQTAGAMADPPAQDEQDQGIEDIIVTSMRVRQGGAQDAGHFRKVAAEVGMPRPESLTVEGLMGEHDLTLPSARACARLFCLVTESMPAALPSRPADKIFVGLGFASNVDAATWKRAPLNLVAVVDKSGSMSGTPLDLVRRSLRQIVGQMGKGDRISIILYGDAAEVYLKPTDIAGGRARALAAIDGIESDGSTDMEEGLKVGYETAFTDLARFKGDTRLMLFTDEQPNVGRTDAASFMGMAETASRRGVGLTTIGVGLQFGADLAATISSVRGGNLFFIANETEVKSVFAKQLDTMVSEVAHDVRLTMTPQAGYSITGVFGVPDDVMTQGKDGTVTVTVPTAFFSANGGGIFASLGKDSARALLPAAPLSADVPLMRVSLSYVDAASGAAGADETIVAAPAATPSAPIRLAHLLVDEYLAMKDATIAFHANNDPKTAFSLLNGIARRIEGSRLAGLDGERKLIADMIGQAAFYAGYSGELPRSMRHLSVIGDWQIIDAEGFKDLHRGDRVSFSDEDEFIVTRARPRRDEAGEDNESYEINERQIHLPESKLVMNYRTAGDRLYLSGDDGDGRLRLTMARVEDGSAQSD